MTPAHPSQLLDDTVHQRVRLGILAVLTEADQADFSHLKDALDLTDGNLSRHLRVLEEAGYVPIDKTKRPEEGQGEHVTKATLVADGLVKRFGDFTAVDHVSFQIAEGETFGLLGPNGAGKTTSISIICGLLESDGGSVTVDGEQISTGSTRGRSSIGLVPQELAIYPDLSGAENLKFFGRLYGLSGEMLDGRVARVLEVVGLTDRRDDHTKEYSGGMKRRLNIGIGLLHNPKLLILDEPTVGVDPQSRNAILESVEALSREGMSVLYTTHYMEEAERLCDRVAIIDEGTIQAEGTRRELVSLVGEQDRVSLAGSGNLSAGAEAVRDLPGVTGANSSDGKIEVLAADASSILPELMSRVSNAGGSISGVEVVEPNLEAVFLHLTGKALRD